MGANRLDLDAPVTLDEQILAIARDLPECCRTPWLAQLDRLLAMKLPTEAYREKIIALLTDAKHMLRERH